MELLINRTDDDVEALTPSCELDLPTQYVPSSIARSQSESDDD